MCKLVKYLLIIVLISCSFYLLLTYKFKIIDNGVYYIKTYKDNYLYKEGNGFVYKIDDYAYIITNYHVINDSDSVYVYLNDLEIEAKVLNYDEYNDIAIILADSKYFNHKFKISSLIDLKDNNISVITYDKIIKGELVDKLSSINVNFDNYSKVLDLLKISADIREGYSGSPVLDSDNNVVGIMSMVDVDDDRFSYAIPLDIVKVNDLESVKDYKCNNSL